MLCAQHLDKVCASIRRKQPFVLFIPLLPPQPLFQAHELVVADDQVIHDIYV